MTKKLAILFTLCLLPLHSHAETYVGVFQGLGGEAFYQQQFDEQSKAILRASRNLTNEQSITHLNAEQVTRTAVLNWLEQISSQANTEDTVIVYLVGHGTADTRGYKFNIPGLDLSGEDLLAGFEKINAGNTILISTTSSSGALLKLFEQQNVLLMTATKSGNERNATRFGRFLSAALEAEAADLNKNKSIDLDEAFNWAKRATEDYYESEGILATEHSQLQGADASRVLLSRWEQRPATATNPRLAELLQQREQLDRSIEQLRLRRIGMTDDDYLFEFQNLMLDLANVQDQIDSEIGDENE